MLEVIGVETMVITMVFHLMGRKELLLESILLEENMTLVTKVMEKVKVILGIKELQELEVMVLIQYLLLLLFTL